VHYEYKKLNIAVKQRTTGAMLGGIKNAWQLPRFLVFYPPKMNSSSHSANNFVLGSRSLSATFNLHTNYARHKSCYRKLRLFEFLLKIFQLSILAKIIAMIM